MGELQREYGVVSPDGKTHWGTFINRPLVTEQDRAILSITLKQLATELGFDIDEFINRFRWTSRIVTEEGSRYVIDDPTVIPGSQQPIPTEAIPDTVQPEPIQASVDQ